MAVQGLSTHIAATKYELDLLNVPFRISQQSSYELQRLCRFFLNSLSHIASSFDAYGSFQIDFGSEHKEVLHALVLQLSEAMKALRALVYPAHIPIQR